MAAAPLVLSDPGYGTALTLVAGLWLAEETVIGLRGRLRDRSLARDRGSQVGIIVSVVASVWLAPALASALPGAHIGWQPHVLAAAGLVLMLVGIGLRGYAVQALGPYFTTTVAAREGQPVVERGPYHFVRHPSYSGILLILAGYCLAFTNWAAPLAIVPAALGLAYRIRVEERALLEALGEPYADYMRRTRRLIPHLI
jgi:protein-S-isoprenylcysteine O-methyltransferase Ste14